MAHHLSLLLLAPVSGAVLVLVLPPARGRLLRGAAIVAALLPLAVALPLWTSFEPRGHQWQFVEQIELASIGSRYAVGVDGLGLSFVLLAAVVGAAAMVAVRADRFKLWAAALLVGQTGVFGVFVSLDLLQMAVFWQLAVAAYLVLIAASESRRALLASAAAAIAGAAAMFAAVLMLREHYQALASVYTFDIRAYHMAALPTPVQGRLFALFAAAFASPLMILLLQARSSVQRAESRALVLLTSALLVKIGAFGFLRVVLPVLPEASRAAAPALVIAALAAAVIAAAIIVRSELRSGVFWIGLAQLSLAMAGVFAGTPDALTGGAVALLAQGLAVAGLFAIASLPVATPFVWLGAAAALAGGVTGARLIATGLSPMGGPLAAMSVLANVAAVVALIVIARGPRAGSASGPGGFNALEIAAAAPLLALSVATAVYPAPLVARLETSVARLVMRVRPEYASQVSDCLKQPAPSPPPGSGLPTGMMMAAPCTDGSSQPAGPGKHP